MSYNNLPERHDNTATPTGREDRTASRRRDNNSSARGRFEPLPSPTVFETPWDIVTPDATTTSFPSQSLQYPPNYDSQYNSQSARPLLSKDQVLLTPDSSDPSKTRFEDSIPEYSTGLNKQHFNDEDVYEEFGPVPSSANSRTDFQIPPRRPELRGISTWVPAVHPWWPQTFEPIHWPPLIFLTITVLITYPLLYVTTLIAQERSLFWTRFIVGSAASVLGFTLGLGMMEVGKRLLEAATWATLIHRSMDGRGGVTLGDLDTKSTYPHFTWLGVRLFFERNVSRIYWRGSRPYDKKPWSFYVLFFIFISILAASISFLLGRLVDITTSNWLQDRVYREVTAIGDLSPEDIASSKVQLAATESFVQTWTLSPFGAGGQVTVPIKLRYEDEDVYFAELSEHLLPGGLGLGTFKPNHALDASGNPSIVPSKSAKVSEVPLGSVVRYSRWGIRIQCAKLPDARQNIIPLSAGNMTYAYVPRDTVFTLLDGLGLQDIPFTWNRTFLKPDDQVPEGIDMSKIGLVGAWENNGVAQSFYSYTIDGGDGGKGWAVLTTIMMRLDTKYTPNGSFAVYSQDRQIGYDTAVCVEAIEPWVVDAYNATTGRAQTFKVIGKGGLSTLSYDFGKHMGHTVDSLGSTLSSVGKFSAYAVAFDNSRNQILKDNGRDFPWVPNPTAISWTDGFGPRNYTSLSIRHLEASLGNADGAQLLPYLTGSQPIVAYQYTEDSVAYATILPAPTIITLVVVLLLAFASSFFVPKLPLGVPRRDFGQVAHLNSIRLALIILSGRLFTWIAAFEGDGILHQAINHQSLDRNMDLEELQRKYGAKKVRYGA